MAQVNVTVTKTVDINDGDVLAGPTPKGKQTTRHRVNGTWLYPNGKATGESDQFYAEGLASGRFTHVSSKSGTLNA